MKKNEHKLSSLTKRLTYNKVTTVLSLDEMRNGQSIKIRLD